MSQPFVGEICCFGFNFAPVNWAQCNGQIMAITQNTPLFSLLGTTYGGNGQTTFGLPNLQGQAPMHPGTGRNGYVTVLGEALGTPYVTLNSSNLPVHNHTVSAAVPAVLAERTAQPTATSFFSQVKGASLYVTSNQLNTTFAQQAITPSGGSQPHNNMQPYLVLNFCIALYGVFPSRN